MAKEVEGWIKLHRQLLESKWGSNLEMLGFWTALLIMANHKSAYTKDGTLVNQGQLMTSRDSLSEAFNLSPSKIYRMLKMLCHSEQIEQQTSNKNTLITILKWQKYQGEESTVNNKRTTDEQQVNINKNEKNVKNNSIKAESEIFDHFRKQYPGTKLGLPTEFSNFQKKHKDWKEVLPFLETSLKSQILNRTQKAGRGEFVPEWKHLKTWINTRSWEQEAGGAGFDPAQKRKNASEFYTEANEQSGFAEYERFQKEQQAKRN